MMLALVIGLYLLGAALLARRFGVLAVVQLSDEPGPGPDATSIAPWAAVLWPLVVVVLVCAAIWMALSQRSR
jgi:hypothetical protein